MSEWISVKERLPPSGHRCLVCIDGKVVFISFYGMEPFWFGMPTERVTHWMPLPETPVKWARPKKKDAQ